MVESTALVILTNPLLRIPYILTPKSLNIQGFPGGLVSMVSYNQ